MLSDECQYGVKPDSSSPDPLLSGGGSIGREKLNFLINLYNSSFVRLVWLANGSSSSNFEPEPEPKPEPESLLSNRKFCSHPVMYF